VRRLFEKICFLKVLVPKLPELMGKMFKVRFIPKQAPPPP